MNRDDKDGTSNDIPNTSVVADLELSDFWSNANDLANNLVARNDRLYMMRSITGERQ